MKSELHNCNCNYNKDNYQLKSLSRLWFWEFLYLILLEFEQNYEKAIWFTVIQHQLIANRGYNIAIAEGFRFIFKILSMLDVMHTNLSIVYSNNVQL